MFFISNLNIWPYSYALCSAKKQNFIIKLYTFFSFTICFFVQIQIFPFFGFVNEMFERNYFVFFFFQYDISTNECEMDRNRMDEKKYRENKKRERERERDTKTHFMIILFVPPMMITLFGWWMRWEGKNLSYKISFFINCNTLLNLSTKYSIFNTVNVVQKLCKLYPYQVVIQKNSAEKNTFHI